jgi:hypothetical protein
MKSGNETYGSKTNRNTSGQQISPGHSGRSERLLKTREDWREAVADIPVFDTHSHINNPGVPIGAQSIWDIVHYFWFLQELESVGYPKNANDLAEAERIGEFVRAFHLVRSTVWASIVQETVLALYGAELTDEASLLRADEAVREKAQDAAWPRQVLQLVKVTNSTVNSERAADFPGLQKVGVAVPLLPGLQQRMEQIMEAQDPVAAAGKAAEQVRKDVADIASRGWRGMRVQTNGFENRPQEEIPQAVNHGGQLQPGRVGRAEVEAFLSHAVLDALSEQGMFAQFFLGIYPLSGSQNPMAVSAPRLITNLYPLFERYRCGFELVAGAPGVNMDVAQAARIYPNVHAGGLWWYNFRNSTYLEAMQARLEAVPASKSVILASDARCVEWCFAKTLLVKRLVADFFHQQVRDGWINESDALWVAREWLHDAAARRYL